MYFSLVLQLANIVQANHTEKKWECFGFLYMMSSFASTTNNLKSYPVIRIDYQPVATYSLFQSEFTVRSIQLIIIIVVRFTRQVQTCEWHVCKKEFSRMRI
jgi:hypothetical protein